MKQELNFGFIGVGQCGGNIANEFAKLGYKAIAINTAQTDLDKLDAIPNENRLLVNLGIQGAGKNPEIGENALVEHNEKVLELVSQSFDESVNMIYVCAGLGGGTGSGISPLLAQVLVESGYPIGAIVTLPTKSEAPKVQLVALEAFGKISQIMDLASIFVIDNAKSISSGDIIFKMQYSLTNLNIAKSLKEMNDLTTKSSDMAFDARDFLTLLEVRGLSMITSINIDDLSTFGEIVTRKIKKELEDSFYCTTDFEKANGLGIIFEVGKGGSTYITQSMIDKVQEALGTPFDVFTAIYEDNTKKQDRSAVLRLVITGLPIPEERLATIEERFVEKEETLIKNRQRAQTQTFSSSANYLDKFNKSIKTTTTSTILEKKNNTSGMSALDKIKQRKSEMHKK